jgi:acyl-CoA oxidase
MIMFAEMAVEKMKDYSDEQIKLDNFKPLEIIHHFSSGFKAIATNYAYSGIDELRQACGGAGFSLASGIADIWQDISPYVIFEGVSVVMA